MITCVRVPVEAQCHVQSHVVMMTYEGVISLSNTSTVEPLYEGHAGAMKIVLHTEVSFIQS